MSKTNVSIAVGAALMAWGGSSITSALGFVGWRQANVAVFALGIVMLAHARYQSIETRMRRLEDASKGNDAACSKVSSLGCK